MLFREVDVANNIDRIVLTNDDIAFATDIDGLRFDFNFGCRVKLPDDTYDVNFIDMDSGSPLEKEYYPDNVVCTKIKYFLRIVIKVYKYGMKVWNHCYDAVGKNVRIELLMADRLGDLLVFLPYIEKFQEKHQCNIYLT
ncbi:MAG: hypothetical protein MJ032_04745, partial [Acidaminococcaceae bacterium]|nr:hypothetical protein [Acidaminococcaceae bacterium]